MKTSLPPPTKEQAARIARIREGGCVCCALLGSPNMRLLEYHHIVEGGNRLGHWFGFFLCVGHHQGQWTRAQRETIEPKKLVSIRNGSKAFARAYDTQRNIWQKVQVAYGYDDTWPESTKIVPRPIGRIA